MLKKKELRYSRQIRLKGFGQQAQDKLSAASVFVAGAGGLGVPVLQYLTGMGVGIIGIADHDRISVNNLHRQVLYSEADTGKLKVEVAAEKLAALNPEVKIIPFPVMLSSENALQLLEGYDLVIDATDNFEARYLINDACVILGKPFIYGAVQGFEGHVSVFNYKDGPTYRCLYPVPPGNDEIPDCNAAGVLGVVPGIIGCHQALEAVKILTGRGKPLSGVLKIFDLLNGDEYKMKLKPRTENRQISALQESYKISCERPFTELQPGDLNEWYRSGKKFLLLDVREAHEYESGHLARAYSVPLAGIGGFSEELSPDLPVVLLCAKGGRSTRAAEILLEKGTKAGVYNLAGGMENWIAQFNDHLIEY